MTDLSTIIVNLFSFNSILLSIMILSITLFGVIVGGLGLVEGYQYSTGDHRFSTRNATLTGFLSKMAIGGGAAVGAVLFYQMGTTFAVSGDPTTSSVLDFARKQSISGTYCEQFRYSITLIWMIIGTVALFNAFTTWTRKSNGEMIPARTPILYLVGGVLCYFVNGVTAMAAKTIGLDVGLENMCRAFALAG